MARCQRKFITKTGEDLVKYYLLTAVMTVIFSACSANTEQTANGANSPAPSMNQANANALAATNSNSPPPPLQPYNGAQNFNPAAFNATNDNLKVVRVEPKKDELPYGSRSAPDDSVLSSSSRGKDFVETRTFKNHAVLEKVEKIMDGKTEKYKVYLKNGKVLDAPAEKMTNFSVTSPEGILAAVGMLPKPAANTAGKQNQ